jgi:Asp-tRNA(Asn)/Glu-tRNA(Gln) amidotransferase C subunit
MAAIIQCSQSPLREEAMALSTEERIRELAGLVGIPIMETEVAEVAARFESLMVELDRLTQLDLSDIQPITIFPEEE